MYKYHGYGERVLETLKLLRVGACLSACLCIYLREAEVGGSRGSRDLGGQFFHHIVTL